MKRNDAIAVTSVASVAFMLLTAIGRKPKPTMKLATQLTVTAIEVAMGRADELNSSVTRNHGIEPGPVAKKITYTITNTMLKYESQEAISC